MRRTSAPAFSLVELLLAVAVFAIVGTVSTITFATTVRLQTAARQAQGITVQTQKALQIMAGDVRDASYSAGANTTNGLVILTANTSQSTRCASGASTCYPSDAVLVMNVPIKDTGGYLTGTKEKHVYCLAPVKNASNVIVGKRLARFVVPSTTTLVTPYPSITCDTAGIKSLFTVTVNPDPTPTYLTDSVLGVVSLRAWPLWTDRNMPPPVSGNLAVVDPPAVRLEMVSQYNASVGNPALEQRTSDVISAPPQMTLRTTAIRNLP